VRGSSGRHQRFCSPGERFAALAAAAAAAVCEWVSVGLGESAELPNAKMKLAFWNG
jgi:hypothetical protein